MNKKTVGYGVVGHGSTVVFLHGWGLAPRAYQPALERLAAQGVRVYAPTLPGFAGTEELPESERNLPGYARWVGRFLDALDIRGPVTFVGHSFGGGVATQAAHDMPHRTNGLVLVNSIGGAAWTSDGVVRSIDDRPLWDWALQLHADTFSAQTTAQVVASIVSEAVRNVVRNPLGSWRAANLARTADLNIELGRLVARRLPVSLVWGSDDTFIPRASFDALQAALPHAHVIEVEGNHCWLVGDAEGFGHAMEAVFAASSERVSA